MAARKGNATGAKGAPGRILSDELRRQLARAKGRPGDKAQKIIESLLAKAESGNLAATSMVFDRLEGRPAAQLTVTDADGDSVPIIINITTSESKT